MQKREFYLVLTAVLLTVFVLSLIWEFYFEDFVSKQFLAEHKPEPLQERWEYVVTITVYVFISLIYPAIIGRKLIAKQQELIDTIKRAAEEDYLTGLYNRRKLCELLEIEIKRSRRYHKTFSIILLDIDHFKNTNDTFGHNLGDSLLLEIAVLIKKSIRESDMLGRWGGEEFLIICPETLINGAFTLAEKLRINVESHQFTHVGHKTASFGITRSKNNDTAKNIVARADDALYSAKRAGRNAVAVTN
jgi:diguanylate cyclase (GGDEF)-like protein